MSKINELRNQRAKAWDEAKKFLDSHRSEKDILSAEDTAFASAVVPYQFPFLQMGLFLLVLFGMEVVLSVWMVRRQKKQSLAEQMRAQG